MTYEEYVTQCQDELRAIARLFLDDKQDEAAIPLLVAIGKLDAVKDQMRMQGFSESPMLSQTAPNAQTVCE